MKQAKRTIAVALMLVSGLALPAMAAGGPYEATVCGAKGCRRLRDVLVGELVVAIGDEAAARDASRVLTIPQEVAPKGPNPRHGGHRKHVSHLGRRQPDFGQRS